MTHLYKCKSLDVHCTVKRKSRANGTPAIASSARRNRARVVPPADALTLRAPMKLIRRQGDNDDDATAVNETPRSKARLAPTFTQDLLALITVAVPKHTTTLSTCSNATSAISATPTSSLAVFQPSSAPSAANLVASITNTGNNTSGPALPERQLGSPQSARLHLALPVGTIAAIIMICLFCITIGLVIYVTQKGKSWRRFRERQLRHESQMLAFRFGSAPGGGGGGSGGSEMEKGRRGSRSQSRTSESGRSGSPSYGKPYERAPIERSKSLKSLNSHLLPSLWLDRSLLDLQSFEESGPSSPYEARKLQEGPRSPREVSPVRAPNVDGGMVSDFLSPQTPNCRSSAAPSATLAHGMHKTKEDILYAIP